MFSALKTASARLAARNRARTDLQRLMSMNDRDLRDMGLTRSMIRDRYYRGKL